MTVKTETILKMIERLDKMSGGRHGDPKGAFLGDGVTSGEKIQSGVLAQLLKELVELRAKNQDQE
jgi:hypothetical protein